MVKKYFVKFLILFLLCALPTVYYGSLFICTAYAQMSSNTSVSEAAYTDLPDDPSDQTSVDPIGKKDTLTMDLRGIDVTQFLKVLSKKMHINIIPTKKVAGKITLSLNDIDYWDALDLVMTTQGLAYEKKNDNLIIVMTASEYMTLYGEEFNEKRVTEHVKIKYAEPKMVFNALNKLKSSVGNIIVDESTGTIILIDTPEKIKAMKNAIASLDNNVTIEAFELQYAEAADIQESLMSIITPGPGEVVTDERTNTVIVTDLPGNMNNIKRAIKMLDQETRQVYIEGEIVQLTVSDQYNTGINWSKLFANESFWSGSVSGTFSSYSPSSDIFKLTLGENDESMSTIISLLNTIGDVQILSSPRIAVTNNEEAAILVGSKEPYVTSTTSQSGDSTIVSDNVEFVDIGIKLTVVPVINRDGFVTMKIKPEISSSTESITTGSEDEPRSIIPIVVTSEAETTVKVKDGTTIMIAGLRETTDSDESDGLPYLGRIPVLGDLFKSRETELKQTEILIFITPHIISGEVMRPWDVEEAEAIPDHLIQRNKPNNYLEHDFNPNKLKRQNKG